MPAREAEPAPAGRQQRASQPGGGLRFTAAERRAAKVKSKADNDAMWKRLAAGSFDDFVGALKGDRSPLVWGPNDDAEMMPWARQRYDELHEPSAEVLTGKGKPDGTGTADDPIDVQGDMDRALDLLEQGKHVRLNQPDEVSTLIGKLGKIVRDARESGGQAPSIDLCQVTVAGTNLFCVGNKGHRRIDMPQLEGTALPGTEADTLPRNAKGFVDVSDRFRQALEDAGVTVTTRQRPANRLRATQSEMNAGIVARIAGEIENGRSDDPIYVTRDGYIIDGHHVWAGNIAVDTKDNRLGDVEMGVHEIDMDIGAAIEFARRFAREIGVESASVTVPANAPKRAGYVAVEPGSSPSDVVSDGQFGVMKESVRAAVNHATSQALADDVGDLRPKLSKDEWNALNSYTDSAYRDLNAALRAGDEPPRNLGDLIPHLDAVLAHAPLAQPARLYRGVKDPAAMFGDRETLVGAVLHDGGYLSTTTERGMGRHFGTDPATAGGAVFEIIAPAGTPALSMRATPADVGENEVLLPRGMRMVITADRMEGRHRWLTAVIIPDEPTTTG